MVWKKVISRKKIIIKSKNNYLKNNFSVYWLFDQAIYWLQTGKYTKLILLATGQNKNQKEDLRLRVLTQKRPINLQ